MSISSYSQLQSTIAWYANRDDIFANITNFSPASIDSAVNIAIALAENTVSRDIASRGGIKYQETVTTSLVINAESISLPTDFLSAKSFIITSDPRQVLAPKNINDLAGLYPSPSATGMPEAYAVVGTNTAYFGPVPDSSYTSRLVYYAALPALSSSNTSNWLLTNALQVYISASMVELSIMFEKDDRLQFWKGYYDQKMNDLMGDDRQTRWAAVDSVPRPIGYVA